MEDTVHYAHDTALGLIEWNSTLPLGGGMLHLGPHQRLFSVSMFHQLRCLDVIGRELLERSETAVPAEPTALARHCMNYLRVMVLCRSDTRLESAYNIVGPRIVTSSITHTCNDWSAVYAAAEDNHLAYVAYRYDTLIHRDLPPL
ncbi:hypothetical protein EXIGLDRAFT_681570 [Exidia glandulosa HHB12029]|uniref:Uncharacterized protein n=1 Tax=Exidia glandulosa HHB12029 TaxID=1314781 RepID=A0A165ZUT1_EXIGL|nr:hypothetical protein EXIGLDRAFT_681570 [Exidia glandulosa HHB12029]